MIIFFLTVGQNYFDSKIPFCNLPFLKMQQKMLPLNEYETEPYFLQVFQSITTVRLNIPLLCKSCEQSSIFSAQWCLTQYLIQNKNNFTVINLTKCVNQHCRELEILKKILFCPIFIHLYHSLQLHKSIHSTIGARVLVLS